MAPCDAQALIAELQARVVQLEKELKAMTGEAVKHIVDKAKNAQTIADLSAENAGLREDRERLDWMERHAKAMQWPASEEALSVLTGWHRSDDISLRAAIDAARFPL